MANGNRRLTRSIYIVGPSCTGKTTLCGAIAAGLEPNSFGHVTEVARIVMASTSYSRRDIGLMEMQKAIMDAHIQEEIKGKETHRHLLCDRSAIDPIVYAMLTASSPEERDSRRQELCSTVGFQELLHQYRRSTFILLLPVTEWLFDDGTRHVGDETECLQLFRLLLGELRIEYVELGQEVTNISERVAVVMNLAANNS